MGEKQIEEKSKHGEVSIDKIDEKILKILKKNSRSTYKEIGKQVSLSEGAVRKRLKTLIDAGIIRQFTINVRLIEGVKALILIKVTPTSPKQLDHQIAQTLKSIENVETVYEVTGEQDIATIIFGLNMYEINETVARIRSIEGVADTNTMIVLRSW